jgi:hypothetical protein
LLEGLLLKGFEGEDTETTSVEWDGIELEALKAIDAKNTR